MNEQGMDKVMLLVYSFQSLLKNRLRHSVKEK